MESSAREPGGRGAAGIFRVMVGPELAEWLHRAAEVFAADSGSQEQGWLMIWAQQFLQYLVRGQVMNPVEADVEEFLVACEQKRPLRFRDQARKAGSVFLRSEGGDRPNKRIAEAGKVQLGA